MPYGFADRGIRCGQCGHFLNVLSQAIPELPDPLPVTCPYCGYSASYPKSAICSDIAIMADKANAMRWAFALLAAIGIVLVLGLIATRAHSAEVDSSVRAGARIAPLATERMRDALYHLSFGGDV